jgi:hypothetical protein
MEGEINDKEGEINDKKKKKMTGKEKKELNKFLSNARDSIIKHCNQVFNEEVSLSSLIVCDNPVKGFVLVQDIAYSQLLLNAFKKETLVSEKRNGNYRNILFDYDKYLMISADKHKLIIPGDSLKEQLQNFNAININNQIDQDNNVIETECEICGAKTKNCCSRCKLAFYCNLEHQKDDWPDHKTFCDSKAKSPSNANKTAIKNPILSEYQKIFNK